MAGLDGLRQARRCGGPDNFCGAERLVAGTAFATTPGDRAERFHGDRSHARRGASLTSRRRIGSIEKAPFPGLFP
jgi:hypothetical protein